jgi:hypothetical protein
VKILQTIIGSVPQIVYLNKLLIIFPGVLMFSKTWRIKKRFLPEFLLHVSLASIIGISVKFIENKSILDFLASYLKVSLIIFIILTSYFLYELFFYSQTKSRVIKNYSSAVYLLLLTVLFSAVSTSADYLWELILLILLYYFWILSKTEFYELFKSEKTSEKGKDERSDIPVNYYRDLFPTRKKEFIRIYNFLEGLETEDPYAISISGSWGEGKTSFTNALRNQFKNEGNEVIYIQPMVLDTREKLLIYVFDLLEGMLNENQIYTGKGSPYKKYFDLVLKFVNDKAVTNFTAFFDIFPEEKQKDLRELKDELEINIEKLVFKNKRIYLIVDDLDRVEKETIYNTLTFIKEIVDFKKITVIFLADYRHLLSEKITLEYLEKFVNMKFELIKIQRDELFNHYLKVLLPEYGLAFLNDEVDVLKLKFPEYIDKFISDIQKKISKYEENKDKEKDNHINEIKVINDYMKNFNERTSNPRYVKKIVSEISRTLKFIESELFKGQKKYNFENREFLINQLILKFSIFKVIFKEDYDDLLKIGNLNTFLNSDINNREFFKIYFEGTSLGIFYGIEEIKRRLEFEFYNAIIFSEELAEEIFLKMKSNNEKLLEEIDSNTILNTPPIDYEKLKQYLEAINYSSEGTDYDLSLRRVKIFTYITKTMVENGLLKIEELSSLLGKSNRNVLIESPHFIGELNHILNHPSVEFNSQKEQTVSLHYLSNVEASLIFNNENNLLMILRLYFLNDNNFSSESLKNSLKNINKLKDLNQLISGMLGKNFDKSIDQVVYFEELFNMIDKKILDDINNNELGLRGYKFFKEKIESFIITINALFLSIKKIKRIPFSKSGKFQIDKDFVSLDETILALDTLYKHVVENKEDADYQVVNFFHMVLNNIGWFIDVEKSKIGKDNTKKLIRIFEYLDKDITDNYLKYDKSSWHYCMIRLTEIVRLEE